MLTSICMSKVLVSNIKALDSAMPKGVFVEAGANLVLTNTQYEAIKSGATAGTDYGFAGTLHIAGDSSSAETITGTDGKDFIQGNVGDNTIVGKGDDVIYASTAPIP